MLAFGLKRNFPRAILHGPTSLGGIGVPSHKKNTWERLNYFLYYIHRDSSLKWKFDISIIYTKIEVETFRQFFSQPFWGIWASSNDHLLCPIMAWIRAKWKTLSSCIEHYLVSYTTFNQWPPFNGISKKGIQQKGLKMINRCRMFYKQCPSLIY